MAPFVKNDSPDPQECPPLGIPAVPPGDVVEVDSAAAKALKDHPIWKTVDGPKKAAAKKAAAKKADGPTDGAGLSDSVTVTHTHGADSADDTKAEK